MVPKPADIVCFEAGIGELPWAGRLADVQQDLGALRCLAADGLIELGLSGDAVEISGTDRVGLVMLPSGRRLVIRSKIRGLVLLEWLAYLGEFPPLNAWLPDAGVAAGDDFHTCLGRLFLYELDKVTRLHLRKDYVPAVSSSTTIRGHILPTQLSQRLHRLPHVPQRVRLRTLDTSHNRILAVALDRLPVLLADVSSNDHRLLAQLRDLWVHVRREVGDPVAAVTEAQWVSPLGYRAALQLARLILIGVALEPQANMGGQAFTMSLALVWERCVRRMFGDLADKSGWTYLPDAARTRRWDDSAGRDDPARWMTADVLAVRHGLRWVLDAKYKRAFGNESRVDRFQMCAYAVGFDADRATLVYPAAPAEPQHRILLAATIAGKPIVVDAFDLPMAAGPQACSGALVQLCLPDAPCVRPATSS